MLMRPISSTAGGGGGGGGGTGFAGFLAVEAGGLGFAFELPAVGFFVVVAGLAADVVCATDTDASAQAATRAAASFEARVRQACMGADSTHAPARRLRNAFRTFAVQLPKAAVDQAYGPPIAPEAPGAITRKSSSSTSLQR